MISLIGGLPMCTRATLLFNWTTFRIIIFEYDVPMVQEKQQKSTKQHNVIHGVFVFFYISFVQLCHWGKREWCFLSNSKSGIVSNNSTVWAHSVEYHRARGFLRYYVCVRIRVFVKYLLILLLHKWYRKQPPFNRNERDTARRYY